ncbi:MAG: type I-E CRISPR-associated protein Cas7/Cse4/CasC [Candidatus Hydrogenedentes bacterium]|nr:type I-E CRISPR-associated protein Cas7/Cse4/CasC [Candidatus Hydrogenedentota bacterium]
MNRAQPARTKGEQAMLIQIHLIQNHAPANLNRDDLGAPKTCYFGGVLRSRISSQCLKRSIRLSDEFSALLGGVRTRRLSQLLRQELERLGKRDADISEVLNACGLEQRTRGGKKNKAGEEAEDAESQEEGKMLVYTTREAIREMAKVLAETSGSKDEKARKVAEIISKNTAVPDMALFGRMLEAKADSGAWKDLNNTVEAALQAAHALSTHTARKEIDYYVAADDVPGAEDRGAGYVDEALFASACYYKYFSISWPQLLKNLRDNRELAAHTVGAFLRGAALVNPTGKQNSFAAHNPPLGILVELRKYPVNYANAFVQPVDVEDREDLVAESIARLAMHVQDLDNGYGAPEKRFWFSPNLRYPLQYNGTPVVDDNASFSSLNDLVNALVPAIDPGLTWTQARAAVVNHSPVGEA